MNKELVAKINALHDQAMDHADEADSLVRKSKRAYMSAYLAALSAAELIPTDLQTTECEPSRSVMHRSAMFLAIQAGMPACAEAIAKKILTFSPYAEIQAEAQQVIDSVVKPETTESTPPVNTTP